MTLYGNKREGEGIGGIHFQKPQEEEQKAQKGKKRDLSVSRGQSSHPFRKKAHRANCGEVPSIHLRKGLLHEKR